MSLKFIQEMTKFGSRSDTNYMDVVGELQRWTKAVRSSLGTLTLTSDQEGWPTPSIAPLKLEACPGSPNSSRLLEKSPFSKP